MGEVAAGLHSRRLIGLLAALAAALGVVGCGSSSGGSSRASTTALKRAAFVSTSAAGYRVAIRFQEGSAALGGAITGSGTGAFDPPKHTGSMTVNINLPGRLAKAGTLTVKELLSGQRLFLKLPAQVSSKLPGGRPWIEVNLAQLAHAAGIQNLTSLFGGSQTTNPGQFLQYLRAASAHGVKKVATANIDGQQTTRYRATIDLLKAPSAAPPGERQSLTSAVSSLEKLTGLKNIPVNVWVDSQHLVRRLTMAYEVRAAAQKVTTQMRLDFLQYGPQPAPALPPARQVTDAGSLLSRLGG